MPLISALAFMSTPPLFSLKHVWKRFGYRDVLRDLSIDIQMGEFILLIGNNGAGKSTLLRILSSLMPPSKGEVHFRGLPYKENRNELLKTMGVISHESRLYGDLSAQENLKLSCVLYHVEHPKSAIEEALSRVELTYATHLPVHSFSSGMTKRLMIARLLIQNPSFLLLDEPYTGLDQHFVGWLQNFLKEYNEQGGTVLCVTHRFDLGLALANRCLVLKKHVLTHDLPRSETNEEQCAAWLEG